MAERLTSFSYGIWAENNFENLALKLFPAFHFPPGDSIEDTFERKSLPHSYRA